MTSSAFTRSQLDRRGFLRLGGAGALALAGSSFLAACSSSSPSSGSSSGGKKDYGTIALQLSWIKNIEFAGEYFATEKGYYKDAGFSGVTLIANSGSTTAEDVVVSGQALVGLSSPSATAPAIAKGAPLKTIATTYQKNPFCLLSLKEKTPISTVDDLKGKTVGVQSGANQVIWEGFLKANGLSTDDVKTVATQYSITPLESGKYDAHFSYLTNEPILATQDGYTPVTLGFADNGLPFVAETYIVTQDTIDNKRDLLKAFLVAEIKGWTDAVKDPAQSATYAVTKYGKDQKLDQTEQTSEATAQNGLIVTADTNKNGLFTLTQDLIDENIKSLAAMGVTTTADKLFDTSIIDEVYKENPDLIVSLPVPSA
ncbi:ABC transporter substrate-binding protein [Gryllotalpicola ginsengisoli]|uniref:ABC transporter substrate-binding protein n=1 Tax=Gryllotalpicola ginsengisoli TaxID=444608 RepID=UPI0003B317B9|nr:ABC transporter substrate-binding protein [Gryllotalpicola ginsengisoli]